MINNLYGLFDFFKSNYKEIRSNRADMNNLKINYI